MAAGGGGGSISLSESIVVRRERIERACAGSLKVHKSPDRPYHLEKFSRTNPHEVLFSFPASGSAKDWYSQTNFGETKINLDLFPSLKTIGSEDPALVNEAFLERFLHILDTSALAAEVDKAVNKQKQIVFTGHSSGAPIAILATLWTLEKYQTPNSHGGIPPLCITFGSPLVGNHILSHATRREKWSHYFLHYVMRYDIVPRILLAPLSSIDERFEQISKFFIPRAGSFMNESVGREPTRDFYYAIMSNAATVTSHAAAKLMGSTDTTLVTLANFIPLSPYKPFGTYVFYTGSGKLGKQVVVRNHDAVLQLLFFSAQLSNEEEEAQVANRSLLEHTIYGTELQQTLGTLNVVYLDRLENLPLSDDGVEGTDATIHTALNDLGLSTRARLCLRAAAELEKRKSDNEEKIKKKISEEKLAEVGKYRQYWEHLKKGYYDGFREHKNVEDFNANVIRLELAGVWDEIIEKVRGFEVPDEFEGNRKWIDLGTKFRELVEPLDIANYYRHARHYEEGSSSYMIKGRPKRYRYTQKWLEHSLRRPQEPLSTSCFWGEVEELCHLARNKAFDEFKERVVALEGQIQTWYTSNVLPKDVLVEGSTFVKWWKALPPHHKQESCIRKLIIGD
ncbi:hypothetical protein RJT34_01255 [Clitoria ternatea]|uniref:Uncharacterized protein n=1 Tax=Clitoria ternatea TaxID=43366 RepID=A0AAN9KG31_CLITE